MSEERRRRQEARQEQAPTRVSRKVVVRIAAVVAVGLVLALLAYKHSHRYDAFAKCLAAKQVQMYGAYWCPHCAEQKEAFDASFAYVPYVECGIPGSHAEQKVCKDAGVQRFPTWKFPNGDTTEGVFTVDELGARTGCSP